ncbi:TPA: dCTP deaminase [Candidatus Woesearchaeota archaeon]|nr:dCTP deaminase [Candidatus Woesearchaeota archaeon]
MTAITRSFISKLRRCSGKRRRRLRHRQNKMLLSDKSIREAIKAGKIVIKPFFEDCVQPSSIDIHLDNKFLLFNKSKHGIIDVKQKQEGLMMPVEIKDNEPFILHPGEFILGSTLESVKLSSDIAGRIEGKSSLGRLGLLIHSTAGFIDPGWEGNLTLELSNVSPLPITLYYKMKIGQVSFVNMSTPVDRPYGSKGLGSHYQGQKVPVASKFHEDTRT